ncbi:hypothetical protein SDC9_207342 [bioreactor metagenome]|uniref:Uncharacterized protein n=1 Tax=bioreactor metagenome TaxID=1076179 RepID=A0A645J7M8_9ZZZZ
MHHAKRDRPDRRAGEPRVDVVKHRLALLYVDRHTEKGVYKAKRVRSRLFAGARDAGEIRRVGRELDHQPVPGDRPHLLCDLCRRFRQHAKRHAARLDIGAGDVEL